MGAGGDASGDVPGVMPAVAGVGATVAVVADAAAPAADRAVADAGLGQDATVIGNLSGLRAVAMPVVTHDAAELAAMLDELPVEIGAIFLTRTERVRAREAQRLLTARGGRAVITDDDAMAITLTAAVLVYLARLARPLPAARVVILGAALVPVMCPMLLAAGIFNITMWNPEDHAAAPLERVTRDADAVVNLLGAEPMLNRLALDRPAGSIIGIGGDQELMLALPGLFRAIASRPDARVEIPAFHACALGLVAATPPRRLLPSPHNPTVTYQVATAASRALHRGLRHDGGRSVDEVAS